MKEVLSVRGEERKKCSFQVNDPVWLLFDSSDSPIRPHRSLLYLAIPQKSFWWWILYSMIVIIIIFFIIIERREGEKQKEWKMKSEREKKDGEKGGGGREGRR